MKRGCRLEAVRRCKSEKAGIFVNVNLKVTLLRS